MECGNLNGIANRYNLGMLKGNRIHLRTMRLSDLEPYLELASDISNRGEHFHYNLPTEASLKESLTKDSGWNMDFGNLMICANDDARIVGSLACFQPIRYMDAVELGYILYDAKLRGQGIMPEAVALAVDFIFRSRKIHRIQICADAENAASCKVAEKSGFKYEGTLRESIIVNGVPRDIKIFSLLRSEHEAQRLG